MTVSPHPPCVPCVSATLCSLHWLSVASVLWAKGQFYCHNLDSTPSCYPHDLSAKFFFFPHIKLPCLNFWISASLSLINTSGSSWGKAQTWTQASWVGTLLPSLFSLEWAGGGKMLAPAFPNHPPLIKSFLLWSTNGMISRAHLTLTITSGCVPVETGPLWSCSWGRRAQAHVIN